MMSHALAKIAFTLFAVILAGSLIIGAVVSVRSNGNHSATVFVTEPARVEEPEATSEPAATPDTNSDDTNSAETDSNTAVEGPAVSDPAPGQDQTVRPVRVHIPAIDVDADVIDLGLNSDRTLEVPTDFDQTGWFTGRSVPGTVGPSVVVGHVDSVDGPAVFFRLRDLEAGHIVEIHLSDGTITRYRVTESKLVDKEAFPTAAVYGPTEAPTLRLITCGGDFNRSVRSYEGNLIVFAEHVENIAA